MYAMQCLLIRKCLIGRSMQFPLPSSWIRVPHFDKGCNVSLHQSHCPGCDSLIAEFQHIRKHLLCAFTSVTLLKKTTKSAAEYQSTPNRWVCALLMQSSTMSSSEMEEASSGVPSLLVMETTNNLSCNELGD